MEGDIDRVESPEAFLTRLGRELCDQEGVDRDLADILRTHILKGSPVDDAVAQAKAAILKLANKRAKPPEAEEGDG